MSPYSTATITKSPKSPPFPVDSIQQLINQVTSQNIETSKTALMSLDKMLLRPDVRQIGIINYMINFNINVTNFPYFR